MRTFLDSGVLVTGWERKDRLIAIRVMEDESQVFYSSELVKLELLPKALFHRQELESEFNRVRAEGPLSSALSREAFVLAKRYGLAAVEALNVAAAIRQEVEDLITTELPGKPLFRVKELKVRSLQSLASG